MSRKKRKAATKPVRSFTFNPSNDTPTAFARMFFGHLDAKPAKTLAGAVAEQVAGLTAEFDGAGHDELPAPERDLSGYRDAFASAAANCPHEDAVELLYAREWVCDTCGRMLNRDDMRRARAGRSIWDYFR